MTVRVASCLLVAMLAGLAPTAFAQPDPSAAGLHPERIKRLSQYLQSQVEQGDVPGVVVGISRNNRLAYLEAFGHRHDDQQTALSSDAVFDLSVLSEPLVAAGALAMQERGTWLLHDTVGNYLDAFKRRPVRLIDLLRHSAGAPATLPGPQGGGPRIRHSLQAALGFTGDKFVQAMADSRNWRSAGQRASAGFSFDLLGVAMERAAGRTLGTLLLTQLFIPLDMWDTGFNAGQAQLARAMMPPPNATLQAQTVTGVVPVRNLSTPVSFDCGGACLYSTASDYLQFLQMLLNGGRANNRQVLSAASVRYMTRDQLGSMDSMISTPDELDPTGPGRHLAASGFGLGVSVRPAGSAGHGIGSPGEFSRAAPTGPYFWVDPTNQLAVVVLTALPAPEPRRRLHRTVRALTLQALTQQGVHQPAN